MLLNAFSECTRMDVALNNLVVRARPLLLTVPCASP